MPTYCILGNYCCLWSVEVYGKIIITFNKYFLLCCHYYYYWFINENIVCLFGYVYVYVHVCKPVHLFVHCHKFNNFMWRHYLNLFLLDFYCIFIQLTKQHTIAFWEGCHLLIYISFFLVLIKLKWGSSVFFYYFCGHLFVSYK